MRYNKEVSIIIPSRNEERFIGPCLDSIISNDWPKDRLEILIVDGKSEDKTLEIVKRYIEKYPSIKLFENPKKITPSALNIGIKNSEGEFIIRMDAHSRCQKDYISKCIRYLKEYKADNVGGIIKTTPSDKGLFARSIAYCLSSFFGAGGAYFRTGADSPKWVDTVFGGCYKREVFDKIGFFNENLERTQDLEFNLRLKRSGGKILLAPDIVSYYYPKSKIGEFFIHNFKDGVWITYPFKFIKLPFRIRHYIPLIFVIVLLSFFKLGIFFPFFLKLFFAVFLLYLLFDFLFSVYASLKEKDIRYIFSLAVVFPLRHIGYGLGSVWGIIKLILRL
ncbi:MAG: glycosyltransferase family 2 protein [Candidatus Pacebacteria bacterium]|nr:glycosyltransferase family 2 protein [Candidatus Paceibacterota bacterium]